MDLQENVQKEVKNNDGKNPNDGDKKTLPLKNRYTLKQKLDVVKEEEFTSIHAVSNKNFIDSSSIWNWIKQKGILEKENNKANYRIKVAGRKAYTFGYEPQIFQWIKIRIISDC